MRRRTSLVRLIGKSVKLIKAFGGEYRGLCPFHGEKTPSFSVNETKGLYLCRGSCGASGDAINWVMQTTARSFTEAVQFLAEECGLRAEASGWRRELAPVVAAYDPIAAQREAQAKMMTARQIWGAATALSGSLAERYLNARGIYASYLPGGQWPATLRFSAECLWIDRDADGKVVKRLYLPAMIAAVQNVSRQVTGVHRTYLRRDGSWKAGLVTHDGSSADKKMSGVCIGGAVRLGPAGTSLNIAEGLETSLTVMMGQQEPVWAALSLANMGMIELPEHVHDVVKWTDSDEGNRDLARESIARGNERHAALGIVVHQCPAPEGHDWNSWHMTQWNTKRGEAAQHAARMQ